MILLSIFDRISSESWSVLLVGMLIVFSALVSLALLITFMPTILRYRHLLRKQRARYKNQATAPHKTPQSGATSAAIAVAIYRYFDDTHDTESHMVTIKKIARAYSPWSSKIYTVVMNYPKK